MSKNVLQNVISIYIYMNNLDKCNVFYLIVFNCIRDFFDNILFTFDSLV